MDQTYREKAWTLAKAQQEPAGEPLFWYDEEGGELYQPTDQYRPDECIALYTRPAVPLTDEASPSGVMFAVEQSIKNGNCPWEIEVAYEEYERERQAAHKTGGTP
jgi:hypothetical protein